MSTQESFWKAQIDATETLCHLLDEQGVEHKEAMPYILFNTINRVTEVRLGDGRWFRAIEMQDHSLMLEINGCTPEQVIAATLGPGTCRAVSMRERDKRPYLHDELVCSKCGCQLAHEFGHVWQHFCPNCGRRVVEPTTNDVGAEVGE